MKRGSLIQSVRGAVLAALCISALAATAAVVRPAPGFTFRSVTGKSSLASLRGQPVVLVLARGSKTKELRTQMKSLQGVYHDCASRGAIFIAALADGGSTVPSDIPFVLTDNPGPVASAYGMGGDFLIAVIGRDGNLDFTSGKPVPGSKVLEVIKNNFDVQQKARREIPKGPSGR